MIQRNEMKLENWLSFYTQFSLIKQNWCGSTNRKRLWAMRSDLSVSYYHISMPCWDQSLFAFSLHPIHTKYSYCSMHASEKKSKRDHAIVVLSIWGSLTFSCTHKQQCEEACEKNILNDEGGGVENYLWWLTNKQKNIITSRHIYISHEWVELRAGEFLIRVTWTLKSTSFAAPVKINYGSIRAMHNSGYNDAHIENLISHDRKSMQQKFGNSDHTPWNTQICRKF